ncbi:Protein tyrosine phosphatase domain-containing protein 1 [Schistosoma japonicum]|nr:Protein tyrosine phosphatase domain-containing protein 1 [Schistosoma japonicum]
MYILENLDWDGKYHSSLKCRNENLKSLNSPASDVLRQGIPERNLCLLFCGGSKCKYCNPPSFFDDNKMHLKGLYSTWITQNILATSRPSEELINRFNIIEQFKRMKICSIFNMQTPGEHSSCGYGLQTSGFSYDPVNFMKNNINFYNFGWCDYNVASLQFILDTVIVIQFAIYSGKIAIHCHAGLGRTGVIIACYLVFNNRISAGEAINYVRFRRPGSIQTQNQVGCIYEFEKFLCPYRTHFASHSGHFSLSTFLQRQNVMSHDQQRNHLRNIPNIIYMCCKLLVRFIITGSTSVLTDSSDYVNRMVNNEDSGQSSRKLSATPVTQLEVCTNSLSDENTELTDITLEPDNTFKNQGVNDNHSIGARSVTKALLTTQYPEFVANETERWKKKFNNDPEAWDDFEKSSLNPMVLVKLIDDWLMHLKSPVLRMQDLLSLQQYPLFEEDILASLEIFEKVSTLLYLEKPGNHSVWKIVTSIKPISARTRLPRLLISRPG